MADGLEFPPDFFHFGTAFLPNPTGTLNGILPSFLVPKDQKKYLLRVSGSIRSQNNMSGSRYLPVIRVSDLFEDVLGRVRVEQGRCDICNESQCLSEGTHVVPLIHKEKLEDKYQSDRANLPCSANDPRNGLLLCQLPCSCHSSERQ
jgi:hypothetical protein